MSAEPSSAPLTAEELALFIEECHDDPLLYIRTALGDEPRVWQIEVLEEIGRRLKAGERHIKLHIRTCHTSGKTWLSARLVHWWQATRAGARTLTTAPNQSSIEKLLWTELRAAHAKAAPDVQLGRMLTLEWQTGGDDDPQWFAIGRSSDKPEGIEGHHSWAMARIVDEAKAVDDGVFIATEGAFFGSEETLDIWISTPSIREGKFFERDIEGGADIIRKVVTIEDLIRSGMPGAIEAKARALAAYGGESSFEYRARAMAEYIETGEGVLFPYSQIERAMLTDEEREAQGLPVWHVVSSPTMGYDVAGSANGDQNAVAPVHGPDHLVRWEIGPISKWYEQDTTLSRDRSIEAALLARGRCIRADVMGLGKPVADMIREAINARNLQLWVEPFRAADPPEDEERFLNKKAECAWQARLTLEKDGMRLPKDPLLRKQMAKIRYEIRNGKIRIVDPDDSPDLWDAILIGIGGVYHSLSPEDVTGGGFNAWGPSEKLSGWTKSTHGGL